MTISPEPGPVRGPAAAPRRRREVSIALQTDKRPEQYATLAAAAQTAGFDGVSVFADLGFQPPAPALATIAAHTTTARLGAACHSPAYTHPVDIAAQTAALDLFSGGRAYCGLARGAWLDGLRLPSAGALGRLTEAVTVIRQLLVGQDSGFDGRHFALPRGFRLHTVPEVPPPLLIGTWGRRTARLAGELGVREVKIGGSAHPSMVALMRSWLPPEVALVVGAVTVCDTDGAAARALARREVCLYLDVVGALDETIEIPAAVLSELRAAVADSDTDRAAALVDDEMLDAFTFAGSPAQISRHAMACFEAGADRLEFGTPHGCDPLAGIALLGSILAEVRA